MYGPYGLPVEQINTSTGAVTYLHHDQAGSTRLLTGSTGTVTGKCSYAAYGTPTCEGTATTPFGYDGQYTSSDTGLIYLLARVYDPATAQFLSVDPAVAITREPYNYAGDNPLNYKDRSGLGWEEALEGPSIPNPWGEAEHASEELLRPGVEAVEHGAENVWHAINENEEQGDEGETALRERQTAEKNCGEISPNFNNPEESPGPGWEWRGDGPEGSNEGAWFNPDTKESLHPDLEHSEPVGPHYDYIAPDGSRWRIYPDGRIEPNKP